MWGIHLFRVLILVALIPLLAGCSNEVSQPFDVGDAGHPAGSRSSESWRSWEPAPGATLTVWNDLTGPPLVLRDPRAVRDALESLPAPARDELLASGVFETVDSSVARDLWQRIDDAVGAKEDRPDAEIEKTTWGTIKIIFS